MKKYVGTKMGVRIYFNPVNERYYYKGEKDGVLNNPLNAPNVPTFGVKTSIGISIYAYRQLIKLADKDKTSLKASAIKAINNEYQQRFSRDLHD